MAKTRARLIGEASSKKSDAPIANLKKKPRYLNSSRYDKSTTNKTIIKGCKINEPNRNIIDASKSLRRAKAMAIIKTSELQKPRYKQPPLVNRTLLPSSSPSLSSSSEIQKNQNTRQNNPAQSSPTPNNETNKLSRIIPREQSSTRTTRSSKFSPSSSNIVHGDVNKSSNPKESNFKDSTLSPKRNDSNNEATTNKNKLPATMCSVPRHSRVASLDAKAKVHLLYDDGRNSSSKHQSETSSHKINLEKMRNTSISITKIDAAKAKNVESGYGIMQTVRNLRSLPVRSANRSRSNLEASKIAKEKESHTSDSHRNKRVPHDEIIEIIDTKKCKRQANLNASAFLLATCTSDYIISSNGPPAALLRQESALKNLKDEKSQLMKSAKSCNKSDDIHQNSSATTITSLSKKLDSSISGNYKDKSHSTPSGSLSHGRVKTYSRKDLGLSDKTIMSLSKAIQKKKIISNKVSTTRAYLPLIDGDQITLGENDSLQQELLIDPVSKICDPSVASSSVPEVTQVQINTTEETRVKASVPSSSMLRVQEAIHSNERHRIEFHQTKATTSQSYRMEVQTTVSQPLSTYISTGLNPSTAYSTQTAGTSCIGQNGQDQSCHKRVNNSASQIISSHAQKALQPIISHMSDSSYSRSYAGSSPVQSSPSKIQNIFNQEPSTSFGSNNSSLSSSLQLINQSQHHNSEATYINSSLNSNSIPMIDVANSLSSQLHQNTFIIPNSTPLQSPSSSLVSPSSSSPFTYGFYHQHNSPGNQSHRSPNQFNQQYIQQNKQHKTGWTGTYQAHSIPPQDHLSNRASLHQKTIPVAGELYCDTNRSFDQFGNIYSPSYGTGDSSMTSSDQSNIGAAINNLSSQQHIYQNVFDRRQQHQNNPYYSFDEPGNSSGMRPLHIPQNHNAKYSQASGKSSFQGSRPNISSSSISQSQAYQDSSMQTMTASPLIGISGQPYLIVHPHSNEASFSMTAEPQNKIQETYCNSHALMIPSLSVSSAGEPVGNVCSQTSNFPMSHDTISGHVGGSSKKNPSKSICFGNVVKKLNKSQAGSQNDRRLNKQTPSKSQQDPSNTAIRHQPGKRVAEKTGLVAIAPFSDVVSSAIPSSSLVGSKQLSVSTPCLPSASSSGAQLNITSFTKQRSNTSLTSPQVQSLQASIQGSNTSSPTDVTDPSKKTQKKYTKKRPLIGLWTLQGTPEEKLVNLRNDSTPQKLLCYPAIEHIEGDIIKRKDSVLLRSGPRKTDLPFIAKISNFWEDPNDGIMMSLLWYYRPEHTEEGRRVHHLSDELFASKHRDINSVACIEDKCYVLTFNEYCRYRKKLRMEQVGATTSLMDFFVAPPKSNSRKDRIPKADVNPELVFCCRQIYDSKQKKIIKNPLINSKYGNH